VIISGLLRKPPRLKWFGRTMVPTLFLATAVGFKLFAAAPDHIWSNGTVLDVDTIRRILAREEGSTARTVRHGLLYAVQSDTSIYLTEEVANGQRAARLKGNVEVMFRLEGDTLFILGEDGKERETHVLKKISRTGEQQGAPPPAPQPASRVLPVDNTVALPKAQPEVRVSPLMQQIEQTAPTSAQFPKPRVYVSDSNSWESSGGFTASRGSAAGSFSGGARPQTVEVIKTFGERCPGVVVTMEKAKADYIVLFDREGGKGYARKRDKIAVFKKEGDVLYSGSTRSVGNAVQDSCSAIEQQGFVKGAAIPDDSQAGAKTTAGYELPKEKPSVPTASATPPQVAPAQRPLSGSPLTNADILKLKGAGLSDQFLIDKIKASPANYHLDVDDLVELKKAGIPEAVIDAMIQASQR